MHWGSAHSAEIFARNPQNSLHVISCLFHHNFGEDIQNSPTQCPWSAFDFPLNVRGPPTTVEISLLRSDFLSIDVALPRSICVEADVPFNRLESFRRILIRPCFVLDRLRRAGKIDVPVRSAAFPFTKGRVRGRKQRYCEGRARNVVGGRVVGFQGPVCVFGVCYRVGLEFDLEVAWDFLEGWRAWKRLYVELRFWRHSSGQRWFWGREKESSEQKKG